MQVVFSMMSMMTMMTMMSDLSKSKALQVVLSKLVLQLWQVTPDVVALKSSEYSAHVALVRVAGANTIHNLTDAHLEPFMGATHPN